MSSYDGAHSNGGVQLLERPVAQVAPATTKTDDSAKERMQRNLDKLLNYDRYSEQAVAEPVVEEVVAQAQTSLADEDIRPTSTTMQFGDDIDQIREEMRLAAEKDEVSYQLNGKGKVVAILYSLAITIILALIVLNTGVLASLSRESASKTAELDSAIAQYNTIQTEIERVSSDQYVSEMAESMGMVKGN
jgi:hypothetical protein